MTARERLDTYLGALRRRLRTHIYVRAAAIAAAGTLFITCAAVWLLAREQFAPAIAVSGRIAIALLLLVAGLLLWWSLRRLRRDGARIFEQRLPAESGRIQTYLDNRADERASPLMELLAADAANIAEASPVEAVAPARHTAIGLAVGVAALLGLVLLLGFGPSYWGFASRYLLLGAELPREAVPVRRIRVQPGDATVRRNSDLAISAAVEGFDPKQAQMFVRFADQPQWERAPMQRAASGQASRFEFTLYAVRASLQYYIEADGTKSLAHEVAVVDLPRIQRVRLTYAYPQWTGLQSRVDEDTRDIRAVAGTNVKVEVFADAPLDAPALIVDGRSDALSQHGLASIGNIAVAKPGRYQIGARVANEFVALSDEYAIEIVPDEKPVVEIRKPGRDWRATSIEEVPVRVQAEDDFRLRDVSLRYSVNGGEWQTLQVDGGVKRSDKESLLRLEELGAQQANQPQKRFLPGDLISYYAVAKDRRQTVQSDLFMVQVQPFERRFAQAQAGAGGGGMGQEQGAISERQREILLATWNLQRNDERQARSHRQLEDTAKMLAGLQGTLAQQARTLAERTRARASVETDERARTFVESLERAAAVMDPAARYLSEFKLREAVPVEQQALQQLLRAESAFRDVAVSMQRENAGGDGMQAARNFTEMFELEMDLEKNQYESESQVSMRNAQKEIDEAIRKLKELAQRQERLAQERNRSAAQAQEQRWKQEQLRREAEDLRRRLAEMNRQQQSSEPADGAPTGERSGEQSAQRSRQARGEAAGSSSKDRVAQALESVNEALREMHSANAQTGSDPDRAAQAAREASRNLQQALERIDWREPSDFDETLQQFAERTQRMAIDQRRVENDLYNALAQDGETSFMNGGGSVDRRSAQQLIEAKQRIAKELSELQRDMRAAVHENRVEAPRATQRLGEIVRQIEGSGVMYRLNRSAAEIYYGRAREAAAREGLITEALDTLEQDLRQAAVQASREQRKAPEESAPEALLAEVVELRRALKEARDEAVPGSNRQGSKQGDSRKPGQAGGERARSGGNSTAGEGANTGLAAWNPLSPGDSPNPQYHLGDSLARQTEAIGQRVRDLANRVGRGELTRAELNALRSSANELRRLSGNPLVEHTDAMLELLDRIELAALAATARSKESSPARASTIAPDAPRDREIVAEYYRRLGDQ